MVLDHVAERTGFFVVARSDPHALGFGHRELHVVDVLRVPQRLEDRVGEPQHQDVLNGLLAEIVVDAEDLRLIERLGQRGVDGARRFQIAADRLLDDDARDRRLVGSVDEAGGAELADAGPDEAGGDGQVEHPIAGDGPFGLDLLDPPLQLVVRLVVVERPRDVEQPPGKLRPLLLVERPPGESRDPVASECAEGGVIQLVPREADHREVGRQHAIHLQVVHGRKELSGGQVAGTPEDDQRAGLGQERPLQSVDQRIARPDGHRRLTPAGRRGRRRRCAGPPASSRRRTPAAASGSA